MLWLGLLNCSDVWFILMPLCGWQKVLLVHQEYTWVEWLAVISVMLQDKETNNTLLYVLRNSQEK